jgi:hypothetical protein
LPKKSLARHNKGPALYLHRICEDLAGVELVPVKLSPLRKKHSRQPPGGPRSEKIGPGCDGSSTHQGHRQKSTHTQEGPEETRHKHTRGALQPLRNRVREGRLKVNLRSWTFQYESATYVVLLPAPSQLKDPEKMQWHRALILSLLSSQVSILLVSWSARTPSPPQQGTLSPGSKCSVSEAQVRL